MNRNYTRIAITFIVAFSLICGGYLLAQRITNTKSDYDAGIAAYQRGHYRVALYDFESRARRGDIVAQFCLAFMCKHGYGVKGPKPEDALQWYTKAAEQGYPSAQNNLGVLYVRRAEAAADKSTFLENLEIAERWLKIAAEQDYAPSQFNLYTIAPDKYVEWLIKAAEQDYAPAQNQLYADGIVKDIEKAVKWLRNAAEQGFADAQNNLGLCYQDGVGVEQNDKEAVKWLKMAAEQGNVAAYYNLGQNYRLGKMVDKNLETAFGYYIPLAQKKGYRDAQNNLAVIYHKKGSKGDLEIASRWFLHAAQQDAPIAQHNIGSYFEEGTGEVPQDNSEAYYWYSLALRNEANREGLREAENTEDMISDTAKAQDRVAKSLKPGEISEIDKRIENWKPKQLNSSGTGFYVNKHYILTNAHVVINEYTDKAWDEFRIPYRRVKLIDWDRDVDLALLYDKRENTKTATFRREPVKFREKVTVFGYPRSGILSYEGYIASGNVSGTSYQVGHPQFENRFLYNAPTQRGNSGGPVFDSTGNVIGVYTGQIVDYKRVFVKESSIGGDQIPQTINLAQNINYAIKFDVVEDFLSKNGISLSPVDELAASEILDDTDPLEKKAKNFTVPVVCFKDKEKPPSEVEEVGIKDVLPKAGK